MIRAFVVGLGVVTIDNVFLFGAYKYGYAGRVMVRFDYEKYEWAPRFFKEGQE